LKKHEILHSPSIIMYKKINNEVLHVTKPKSYKAILNNVFLCSKGKSQSLQRALKMSLRFIAFATNPNDLLGFWEALAAELEEAMRATGGWLRLLATPGDRQEEINWNNLLLRLEIILPAQALINYWSTVTKTHPMIFYLTQWEPILIIIMIPRSIKIAF